MRKALIALFALLVFISSSVSAETTNVWHSPTTHEHGDNCAVNIPNNPFTVNPPMDALNMGEPHEGFKQYLYYLKNSDGTPKAGTFACITYHIGPLTSGARRNDRHQIHIVMQDGLGHMTNAAWMFQVHGVGPKESDSMTDGGRWRDGSHNRDLAMESDVSSTRARERWWFDTQDDAGLDNDGLIDFYTSIQIEDSATYVLPSELPSSPSNTLFDASNPLHFTCAKLGVSGFCKFNDSQRSTGTLHIKIKKTGTFYTDHMGNIVSATTSGAIKQTLYATAMRDYSSTGAKEYDVNNSVTWPN